MFRCMRGYFLLQARMSGRVREMTWDFMRGSEGPCRWGDDMWNVILPHDFERGDIIKM